MKILMAGMHWFPERAGGLNRYFFGMVHAAPAVGISGLALVAALKKPHSSPLPLRETASEAEPLLRQLLTARRAGRAALHEGTDLVNSHFAKFTYPWLSCLPARTPLVVNFQGPWADEITEERPDWKGRGMAALARHMECAVYRRAARVITLSHSFAEIARSRYGVNPDRVRVVPGAVNTAPYAAAPGRSESRRRLGWDAGRPTLFTVRRLQRRMGIENLITAMVEIRKAHPRALLLLGGKGPLAAEFAAQIERLDLRDHVRLLGLVPDAELPLAYAAADISVVPTVALEGFGLVTVEALASGTPVMGTPIGGTREILEQLDPALLFASPAPAVMAEHLIAALAGKIALPDSAACRAFAARYDWCEVMPRVRAVFEEALNAAP